MANNIHIHSPATFRRLVLKKPKNRSVGFPAIASSVKHMAKYMKLDEAWSLSLKMNQKDGFDCPGCAWPDPDGSRKYFEYCENGIKALAEEASSSIINSEFFENNSVAEISAMSDFELGKLGRLSEPLVLHEDSIHYKPINWAEAFQLINNHLQKLGSPDEAIFYTSGRTSNEAAFLYQLFVRAYGTNNLPDCSNMCHESSGVGLSETLGIGKGSVTLEDIHNSELIIIMGQNPGTNHPRMLGALEKCKQNGGKIISVNPLPEAGLLHYTDPQSPYKMFTSGTVLSNLFLPVKVNGDVAFLKAVMIELLQREKLNPKTIFDHEFINTYTNNFEKLIAHLESSDYRKCLEECGLSDEQIKACCDLIVSSEKIIVCWAMGLTQHENGVDNIREIVNLLLLKGAIGKEGAGTCPVRGHSNVQGDRTMGIWEAPPENFLDAIQQRYDFEPPREHGFATVDSINAMYNGKAKVFFAMGGNFAAATPDTRYTAKALQNCSLTVQVSTKLNRSHLVHGKEALILPCLGRTDRDVQKSGEQFVSCENSMGIVHSSIGKRTPPSANLKSEVAIVCELASAVLERKNIPWEEYRDNYDLIREDIEKVIPGFDDYNKRVRDPAGFYLPNGARERRFLTASGKAEFTINDLPANQLKDGEFVMMTIRSHDQFNTTIYGLNDRYRGIFNERRVVLMNEKDIESRGFKTKTVVDLFSLFNGVKREARNFMVVPYPIPEGNIATYFPEANPLVPIDSFARGSLTPASKRVAVTIELA